MQNHPHVQTPSNTLMGLKPNWPAPAYVHAWMSTREGGVSTPPWDSLNLGDHVGDSPEHVSANRARAAEVIGAKAIYVRQIHGVDGIEVNHHTPFNTEADVAWTTQEGVACTMMVADCLPILVCHPHRKWVAAAHAGWRGLAGKQGQGVVETLASAIRSEGMATQDCLAWLGPCIGSSAFEVGPEVLAAFDNNGVNTHAKSFFTPAAQGKYRADLAGLARQRLQRAGFKNLFGNDSSLSWCTYTQASKYFSHRRDAAALGRTGRMAAYIWIRDQDFP